MGVGCRMCGFDGFCFDFLLWVLWSMVVAFDLWLIFCCGMCGFDGGADGGGGNGFVVGLLWDGFTVVVVGMGLLWWWWPWFGLDLGYVGIWIGFGWFGSDLVAFGWLSVAEFWWKVLCGFVGERQKDREEREMEE